MGRKGGGSSRGSSSGSGGLFGRRNTQTKTKEAAKTNSNAPAVRAAPPAVQPQATSPATGQSQGGGILGAIGSTIVQGMAFGTGSAVAHRAVDSVAGPRQIEHVYKDDEVKQPSDRSMAAMSSMGEEADFTQCVDEDTQFKQCLMENKGNVASCNFFYDVLRQCQANFARGGTAG
jgi:hypothetical protein